MIKRILLCLVIISLITCTLPGCEQTAEADGDQMEGVEVRPVPLPTIPESESDNGGRESVKNLAYEAMMLQTHAYNEETHYPSVYIINSVEDLQYYYQKMEIIYQDYSLVHMCF